MSLILDALKKSEQERRRDKGPDLQTIHQPVAVRAPRRPSGAIWGGLLLAVNVAALGYWWSQRSPAPMPIAAAPVPAATAAMTPAAATTPAPTVPSTTPAVASPAAPATTAGVTGAAPVQGSATVASDEEFTHIKPGVGTTGADIAATEMRIEEVDELPEEVRNNLPAMTFSFHVYSSTPQQRTIIINNRRMREGEEISSGLLLQQITEDGVILLFSGHRIHISVLSGW